MKGSLSPFNKKCGRPGCKKCAASEFHQSWHISYYRNRKHTSSLVGTDQLEQVRVALANYKKLEELVTEFSIAYLKQLKGKQNVS